MSASLATLRELEVEIPVAGVTLQGDVTVAGHTHGSVVFVHGSGSSRRSPRNRFVAAEMHQHQIATLLFDLLTPGEAAEDAHTGALRFDIPFLTNRLVAVTRWVQQDELLKHLGIGYFGASTGAAAALVAAARIPEIQAVVSRGGRSDLAGGALGSLAAPVLFIAGDRDTPVVRWNRESLDRLPGVKRLSLVRGATHLFEEPGTLEKVAELAADWFHQYLSKPALDNEYPP